MLRQMLSLLFVSSFVFAQGVEVVVPETKGPVSEWGLLPAGMAERIRDEGIDHSQAMRLLRDLTGKVGHRLTGSDNFSKACDWAAQEFHAMGVPSVQIEKWGEWKLAWNRGAWIGRITNPVAMDLYVATDAWTAGTNGSKVGVIAAAPTAIDEVTVKAYAGKWVYYSKRPTKELRDACEALGILGWLYRAGDPDAKFPLRVRVFGDHRTAMKPIDQVPTIPMIAIRADQADELAEMLKAGKEVTGQFDIQNTFRDGGIPLYNVIAEIPGSERPDEVVIVCGHLDSWHQAQGCTDNGTGTTSTMEAARILMAVGAKPKRTIRFCLWGGEEQGLLGSHAYVQRHRTEMDKVSAVFNHDTGTNWAQSIGVTNAMASQLEPVFAPVLALLTAPDRSFDGPVFRISKSEKLGGGGGSDHASFLAAGVPGLNWGLTGRGNYFLHTWHTQWDTIDVAIEEYQRHTSTVIALAALGTANLDSMLDRTGIDVSGGQRPQSASYAEAMFDADMEGLSFTTVKADGRAAKMGAKAGDVMLSVNGEEIEVLRDIFRIARDSDGEELTFVLKRGAEKVTAKMKKADLRR
jgi:carboxypeptidase Q